MKETLATIDDLILDYSKLTNIPLESSEYSLWVRPVWNNPHKQQSTETEHELLTSYLCIVGFVVIVVCGDMPNSTAMYVDAEDLLTWDLNWRLGSKGYRYVLKFDCNRLHKMEEVSGNRKAYSKSTMIKVNCKLIRETLYDTNE